MEEREPSPAVPPMLALESDRLPMCVSEDDALPFWWLAPFADRLSSPEEVICEKPLDGINKVIISSFACGPSLTARLNIFLHL